MTTENIEEKIIVFIASKVENVDPATINRSSDFESLGLDSMDRVQLLFDAEEIFDVTFDDEEVKNFSCVGDIVDYISKHHSADQSPEA
ncbi:MAG: acyl carrier protein [Nitrosomonas sp.]|nr:acyl carrier protein [Nitrosomonas sp.]MCW5618751.1 acyl carrier protein [Nitrosomonas sp.]